MESRKQRVHGNNERDAADKVRAGRIGIGRKIAATAMSALLVALLVPVATPSAAGADEENVATSIARTTSDVGVGVADTGSDAADQILTATADPDGQADSGDEYQVEVTYGADAQLPEGTTLTAETVANDSDAYNEALAAVARAQAGEGASDEDVAAAEDALGMAALDVTLHAADGTEVEPAEGAKVSVKVTAAASALPAEADETSLQVSHITGEGDEVAATTVAVVEPADGETVEPADDANTPMGTVTTSDDGTTTAEFETTSFSTFTITWSSYATITVHYVDESGNEIQGAQTNNVTASATTCTFSTYAKEIDGYTYQSAHLDSYSGSTVTSVKFTAVTSGNKDNRGYFIQFYNDSNTVGSRVNGQSSKVSRDVYLVYKAEVSATITLHYVDANGNAINGQSNETISANTTFGSKEIAGYTFDSAHLSTTSGDVVTNVKVDTSAKTVTFYNGDAQVGTAQSYSRQSYTADVYLVYAAESSQEVRGDDYEVTVRGNIPKDVTLVVDDVTDSAETTYSDYYSKYTTDLDGNYDASTGFDFLRFYHIWLKNSDGTEYVSTKKLNLNVTISYSTTPTGWDKVTSKGAFVAHYKKNTSGAVEDMGLGTGSGNSTSLGVKQIKVNGNSITFHLQSFSVVAVGTPTAAAESQSGGSNTAKTTALNLSNYLKPSGKNEWQTVDRQYAGNGATNKSGGDKGSIATIDNNSDRRADVRVQKDVVPTDTENEFYVYLSIDKPISIGELFEGSNVAISTNNNRTAGTINKGLQGNPSLVNQADSSRLTSDTLSSTGLHRYKAVINVYESVTDGVGNGDILYTYETYMEGTTPNCSNGTVYVQIPYQNATDGGKMNSADGYAWLTLSNRVSFKQDGGGSGSQFTLNVGLKANGSDNTYLQHYRTTYTSLAKVVDDIGDNVTFLGVVDCDGSYEYNGGELTWKPVENRSVTSYKRASSTQDTWYENVVQMCYKVRLNVQADKSCADTINDKAKTTSIGDTYAVNKSATLTYSQSKTATTTDGGLTYTLQDTTEYTADFQKPTVRGLLYDALIQKVDGSTKAGLPGATFSFTGKGNGDANIQYSLTGSSGEKGSNGDGKVTWYENGSAVSSPGVQWGTYTIKETEAPNNYKASSNDGITAELCYTTNGSNMSQSSADSTHMTLNSMANYQQVENYRTFTLPLAGESGVAGASMLAGLAVLAGVAAYGLWRHRRNEASAQVVGAHSAQGGERDDR